MFGLMSSSHENDLDHRMMRLDMKKNKRLAVYTNHVEKVSTEIDLPRIKFDSMLRIIFF
jgi:hypothetical protein